MAALESRAPQLAYSRPSQDAAPVFRRQESPTMDKNRTAGAKHELKGAVKELIRRATGNESKEGSVERKVGKV
jgi:hypothetical protein